MPGSAHLTAQPFRPLVQRPKPPEADGFAETTHERARSQAHQPMRDNRIVSSNHVA